MTIDGYVGKDHQLAYFFVPLRFVTVRCSTSSKINNSPLWRKSWAPLGDALHGDPNRNRFCKWNHFSSLAPVTTLDEDSQTYVRRIPQIGESVEWRQVRRFAWDMRCYESTCSAFTKGSILPLRDGESLSVDNAEHLTVTKRRRYEEVGKTRWGYLRES